MKSVSETGAPNRVPVLTTRRAQLDADYVEEISIAAAPAQRTASLLPRVPTGRLFGAGRAAGAGAPKAPDGAPAPPDRHHAAAVVRLSTDERGYNSGRTYLLRPGSREGAVNLHDELRGLAEWARRCAPLPPTPPPPPASVRPGAPAIRDLHAGEG